MAGEKPKGTALFIGAHNDDVEYCAGGMACLLGSRGFDLCFLNVACKRRVYGKHRNADEVRKAYADRNTIDEYRKQDLRAAGILGARKIITGEQDDSFYLFCNESVRVIRDVVEDIRPDIAFMHWPEDSHPDHVEASRTAFRALTYYASCEIHAFEAGPWQTMVSFYPDFLVDISSCMGRIRESLMTFDQLSANGRALYEEKEKAAAFRGHMAGYAYAEAYKILSFPPPAGGPELMLPKLLQSGYRWAGGGQYAWGSRYFR